MSITRRSRAVRRLGWGAFVSLALLVAACGGDDILEPDPALAPFLGDWDGTSLVLTSVANPDVHPDLIELGATFALNVQPSGQYTAILLFAGQSQTEIGQLEVSGSTLTLRRDFPSSSTSTATYSFPNSDRLVLDGDSEFDFNLDGTPEPARVHMEFDRR